MVGSTINLINKTHQSCEKEKYTFIIFREYTIILKHQRWSGLDFELPICETMRAMKIMWWIEVI